MEIYEPKIVTSKRPVRPYSTAESVYAWLCLFAGYLFCRVFPISTSPLGTFLFLILLYGGTAVVFAVKRLRFRLLPSLIALSALAVSASLILSSNGFLHFLAYTYALISYLYWVCALNGKKESSAFSGPLALDYFNALLIAFDSIGELFKAMFYGKAKKTGKTLLRLIVGVGIAVVPTMIVLSLLSYDSSFSSILKKIFDFDLGDVFSHIFSMLLAVPLGMYLFGTYVSAADGKGSNAISRESYLASRSKIQIAPVLTVLISALPILFLYVVFFVSQWKYYVSGFTGVLPEGFSYAEYAREGFFQLCAVSVINLLIIGAIHAFMRREGVFGRAVSKLLTILYSVSTIILISTALSKMFLYIDRYGLTRLRVYTTCLMAVLAVYFVLLTVRQFAKRTPASAIATALAFLLFCVLCLGNADGMIANYNADRYLDGSLEELDVDAMEALGDAGIPALVRALPELQTRNALTYDQAVRALTRAAQRHAERDRDIFAFNLCAVKAERALRDAGFEPDPSEDLQVGVEITDATETTRP